MIHEQRESRSSIGPRPAQLERFSVYHVEERTWLVCSLEDAVEVVCDACYHFGSCEAGAVESEEADARLLDGIPVGPEDVEILRDGHVAQIRNMSHSSSLTNWSEPSG